MKNKTIAIFIVITACICHAHGDDTIRVQMLDYQIQKLDTEYAEKSRELAKCNKIAQKLKTAGSITLATTAVGISANVALAAKRSQFAGAAGGGATPTDTRPQAEKNCTGIKKMCDKGMQAACDKLAGMNC